MLWCSGCAIADPNSCTCEQAGCRITDPTKDIQCCPDNDCNSSWKSPDSSEGDDNKNYDVDDDSDDTKDKETEEEIDPKEEAVSDKDSSSSRFTLSALLLSSFIGFFLCH
ncbi:uncharacterized protein LOC134811407 [Bolinopsis microptera]|uniref:uncharacterized protein LOC134811407 n=1 Tax=Bolinopsis microptera TaxID=2820187 RepID=UPI00307AE599